MVVDCTKFLKTTHSVIIVTGSKVNENLIKEVRYCLQVTLAAFNLNLTDVKNSGQPSICV